MVKRTPTNLQLRKTVNFLSKQKKQIWHRIASDLLRPARQRRAVNIFRINRYSKKGEVIAVPGKVLGEGLLEHSVTVAAYSFSKEAKNKIEKAGGKTLSIRELAEKHPDAKGVKILG
jgi:large subunit ribosomal protein L18e